MNELRRLFDEHADDGTIVWPYTTTLYIGSLRGALDDAGQKAQVERA